MASRTHTARAAAPTDTEAAYARAAARWQDQLAYARSSGAGAAEVFWKASGGTIGSMQELRQLAQMLAPDTLALQEAFVDSFFQMIHWWQAR